jgi:sulfatase modifying factor 1
MVRIPGGVRRLGSDRSHPEEAPVRAVDVAPFQIDAHPVTNRQFAAFIKATGYRTVAERPLDPTKYPGIAPAKLKPGALVFRPPARGVKASHWSQWWSYVPGAFWLRPEANGSVYRGRLDHPVVCVAFEDALAFATWSGKDLPTEDEWEAAARGGLDQATYCWGEEFRPDDRHMANTWTGEFPNQNLALDGYARTSPVGAFPANGYGLFDMAGNVWEWTQSYFLQPGADRSCCGASQETARASFDPALRGIDIPRRTVKGGSHLCHASYCDRYRPAARQPQMEDTATTHIGFRCVLRD